MGVTPVVEKANTDKSEMSGATVAPERRMPTKPPVSSVKNRPLTTDLR